MPNFPSAGYDAEVAATINLQAAARRAGLPVYYTTLAYEPHMRDAGLWAAKIPWIEALQYESVAMDIDERLSVRPEEPVIVKKYPSAFFETDLQEHLERVGVDTVILAGCTTSACVRATAIDSMQRGFKTVIGAEAVGDLTPVLHWLHLTDLASRYVDVARVSELTAYMESCGQNAA
jgi:nicotinamidase-related amidase